MQNKKPDMGKTSLFKSFQNLADPMSRKLEFKNIRNSRMGFATSGRIFTVTISAYLLGMYLHARKERNLKYKVSLSRRTSRLAGHLCNLTLPPGLRAYMYRGWGNFYGVNFDEMAVEDLNNFRNFNQFFTRELRQDARQINKEQDTMSMCSPCDGRILSFGEVNSMECTIDCVKGNDYRLDEFLFGFQSTKQEQDREKRITMVERIIDSAIERGNKVMYCVIYLAPGDYHRYHSPAYFIANYRRHITGYLEPVMPAYLKKHKDVLKENERVNLLGEWAHGFFSISFIGALNVGSITLNFDDTLKTNMKKLAEPYISDKNYQLLQGLKELENTRGHGYISIP